MFNHLLNKEDQELLLRIRDLIKNKIDPELLKKMDRNEIAYPKEYVQLMANNHLLGLRFPKEYGGQDKSWACEMAAIEIIGGLGSSLGCLYSLPSIVGEALVSFGSDFIKENYLKPTLSASRFCAEALTEPRGGSDFFGATTTAVLEKDYYLMNGEKRFVVGSEGADYFFVYAKTNNSKDSRENISAFVVDRDLGVKTEAIYNLLGTRGGGTGRIRFKDVKVPAKNLVGKINGGYDIFNRMMYPERMTSAAGAIGMANAALLIASKYTTLRHAFDTKIMKFEGVNFKVAESISKIDSARALVYVAAKAIDAGIDARRLVSEAKKVSTENGWEVVNHSMQMMGGIGYTDIYPIEKYLRDMRLSMIWTGTNEIMNLMIQHEYYRELKEILSQNRNFEADATTLSEEEKIYNS